MDINVGSPKRVLRTTPEAAAFGVFLRIFAFALGGSHVPVCSYRIANPKCSVERFRLHKHTHTHTRARAHKTDLTLHTPFKHQSVQKESTDVEIHGVLVTA